MKAALCLLITLAGANANETIACDVWNEGLGGTCRPGEEVTIGGGEIRCGDPRSEFPPGPEVPLCEDVCCNYPRCLFKVWSCPVGYTVNYVLRCSTVNAPNRDGIRHCSQQTCCETTCRLAAPCPAKMEVPPLSRPCSANPDFPQCDVATCCVSTCRSSYTCPANYDTTNEELRCTSASDAKGGNSSTPVCTTDLCCRPTCQSNAHKCPAGSGYARGREGVSYWCRKAEDNRIPGVGLCSDDLCCGVITKCPSNFVCEAGTKQKADITNVDCVGTCTAFDCCVDVPVTCAAAASTCWVGTTLKANAAKIACGLSDIVSAADECTVDKCCVTRVSWCSDDTACRADGDSAAICRNGACFCTSGYKENANLTCEYNRVFFAATFVDADCVKVLWADYDGIDAALQKLMTLRRLHFVFQPCGISGEAMARFDSVNETAIVEAIRSVVPAGLLGTQVQVKLSRAPIDNTCKSVDPGATAGVKWPLASGEVCVPKDCDTLKGYNSFPVSHKCVMRRALFERMRGHKGHINWRKSGTAVGAFIIVAFFVAFALFELKKQGRLLCQGRLSAAPAVVESATSDADTQMQELRSADFQTADVPLVE